MKKKKINLINILLIAGCMFCAGAAIIFSIRKLILMAEIPVEKVTFNFTWHDSLIYFMGFIFAIVIAVLIADIIWNRLQNKFTTHLVYRTFFISFTSTIIILLYSNFLFPIFDFNKNFTYIFANTNYSSVFKEGVFVFCILLVIVFIFNTIRAILLKLGAKSLLNLLIGKYRTPVLQEKIVFFLDLSDSTTYAEKLGTERYSQFLQEYYFDISKPIKKHRCEIYRYVGDEIIISWNKKIGIKNNNCIEYYFSALSELQDRQSYYKKKYGISPKFKAGMHFGETMILEIGFFKIEIMYTGDTINTTSRVIDQCSKINKKFLITKELYDLFQNKGSFNANNEGLFSLKGKKEKVTIYSVSR